MRIDHEKLLREQAANDPFCERMLIGAADEIARLKLVIATLREELKWSQTEAGQAHCMVHSLTEKLKGKN